MEKHWLKTFDGIKLPTNNEYSMELLAWIDEIASDNRGGHRWKNTKPFLVELSINQPHLLSDFLSEEPNVHDIINWANQLMNNGNDSYEFGADSEDWEN